MMVRGIALCAALGSLAIVAAGILPYVGGVSLAILMGIVAGNALPRSVQGVDGVRFVEKKLLAGAIVLLGFHLELEVLRELGLGAALLILATVGGTILLGLFFGRLFGLPRSVSWLLGIGSAVCGSSAIASVAPLVSRDQREVGLAVGTVNILGTIGLVLLPALTLLLELDDQGGALLIGGSLQAVGHVVAAGYTVSDQAGELATAVKMSRVALLGPLVLMLGLGMRSQEGPTRLRFPLYLIGFAAAVLLTNVGVVPDVWIAELRQVGKLLLATAMAGVGMSIRLTGILSLGKRTIAAGSAVFACQIVALTLLVKWFHS